tara:strand:- start:510 stop:1541 length:1032 start_codon:yes stop_codon:yes gene_type:complete
MATAPQAITYPTSQTRQPAGARAQWLDDGRLHLHHGPIDLVIGADGAPDAVRQACSAAIDSFATVLEELVSEIALLRTPIDRIACCPSGCVAARMWAATIPHADIYRDANYVTAMASVAGAVADEILSVMRGTADLDRIYVNNGGDIALYLHPAAATVPHYTVGICADPDAVLWSDVNPDVLAGDQVARPVPNAFAGTIKIAAADHIGGIATSGWKGRSHSLGVADLVTVLAPTAAAADVAATLIANAVWPDDNNKTDLPGVHRQPANVLAPDSDLGSRLVTVHVDCLPDNVIIKALRRGAGVAEDMRQSGHISAAYAVVQGQGFVCDTVTQRTGASDSVFSD